jgi:hypothetical protein
VADVLSVEDAVSVGELEAVPDSDSDSVGELEPDEVWEVV